MRSSDNINIINKLLCVLCGYFLHFHYNIEENE